MGWALPSGSLIEMGDLGEQRHFTLRVYLKNRDVVDSIKKN